jgi:hypothetical protein
MEARWLGHGGGRQQGKDQGDQQAEGLDHCWRT